jgi:hypothetical protein
MSQRVAGIPVIKPEFLSDLGAVNISALRPLVERVSEQVWDREDELKENNFDVFHHTRHIIFRFIEGMRDHRCFYSRPIWNVWRQHLLPVMQDACRALQLSRPVYPKVMLARLAAGGVIDRHVDGAGSNLHTHKIHVPVQTNDRVTMFIRDRAFQLEAGRAYEVNNVVAHAVENFGHTDRIHLIFEVFDDADADA